jgi:VWFA-related protein
MSLKRRSLIPGCVVCLLLASATIAVRVGAQQPGSDIPVATIRVNTRMVLVDVVVTDKQGKPIAGLKPENFVLEENGKKQKIATFTTPDDVAKAGPTAPLPPGIYSNEAQYRAEGAVTAFVLDAANTPFADQASGRLQMLKYVATAMKPDQRIAIYTLTNTLHMVQDFTSDPAVLTAALKKYTPQEPVLGPGAAALISSAAGNTDSPATAQAVDMAAREINGFQSLQLAYQLENRTVETLEAMRALGRVLGGLPGRKEIIWLTAAFPFDLIPEDRDISEAEQSLLTQGIQQTSLGTNAGGSMAAARRSAHWDEIRQAAAFMSSAQIALYPIDVRGLMSGMEFASMNDLPARQSLDTSMKAEARISNLSSDHETMRQIAAETGGKAYVNQNEIKDGILSALADNNAAYTLGYYPENKKWDGKYRSIKVKVDRDGAQVRSRKGYFAVDPTQEKARKSDLEVAEALRTAIPATLVSFKAQVKPQDKGKARVVFLVDAHTLTAEDSSGNKKLNVTFYATFVANDGKIGNTRSIKVDQAFKADVYQQILQQGMLTPLDLDVPSGMRVVRLAVRDNSTGNVGTIDAPL